MPSWKVFVPALTAFTVLVIFVAPSINIDTLLGIRSRSDTPVTLQSSANRKASIECSKKTNVTCPKCPSTNTNAGLPLTHNEGSLVMDSEKNIFCRLMPLFPQPNFLVHKDINTTDYQFSMYLYPRDDIVAQNILNNGNWKAGLLPNIINKLKELHQDNAEIKFYFMDLGAHVGWFTLNVAASNFPVISFEPMPTNEIALRASLCLNPNFNVQFFPVQLSDKSGWCHIISGNDNIGDGISVCESQPTVPENYSLRGTFQTKTLDSYLLQLSDEKIGVLKIDVEGSEGKILKGGVNFLKLKQIKYIVTKYTINVKEITPVDFLLLWDSLGYEIRTGNWDGNIIKKENFAEAPTNIDIYLTLR